VTERRKTKVTKINGRRFHTMEDSMVCRRLLTTCGTRGEVKKDIFYYWAVQLKKEVFMDENGSTCDILFISVLVDSWAHSISTCLGRVKRWGKRGPG